MALFKKKQLEETSKTEEALENPPKPAQEEVKSFFRIDTAVEIPSLPDYEDKSKVDVTYPLIAPYCNAHITWDAENNELVYLIEEPELSGREKKILDILEEGVKELINLSFISVKEKNIIITYLEKNIKVLLNELSINLSSDSFLKIMYYIYRDFVGLNELEPLMNDYYIEDIECNGANTPIYVVHRKYRNIRTNLTYPEMEKLTSFVEKLAQKCGKYISYASPLLDGSLPDGSRVNATYTQEVSSRGPTFTVRRFTAEPWSPVQLIQKGTASPEIFAYLWILIEYESSVMVIGGTGTGKTTFLNTVAFFIPPQSRIVSIEDSVTGDSKIIIKLKDEKLRNISIKEFVEKQIDAKVMTIDNKGKITFVKPSNYIKHTVKKGIYEITTSTGRKIKVTQDHSLFSLGDNGLIEVKPTELKENKSFIAVPRVLPVDGKEIREINLTDYLNYFKDDFLQGKPIRKIFEKYNHHQLKVTKCRYQWWKNNNIIKIKELMKLNLKFNYNELNKLIIKSKNISSIPVIFKITNEFLEFCGLWLGDGSYDNYNKNSVIISNQDKECRNVFKKIAGYTGSNYSVMNDKGTSLRLHSTIFYKFMKKVMGFDGYSNTKKIPEFIFGLSNEQLKPFVRGYFSADGCVKKYEVSCASQSYPLLEDLQTIFLRLGIISRINDFNRKDKCINMSISTLENILKFKDIGFLQDRKNKKLLLFNKKATHANSDIIPLSAQKIGKLNALIYDRLPWQYINEISHIGREHLQRIAPQGSEFNDISHTDILWDKVKEIKKISSNKEIEVFDLSIPGYEKFLCNNIFVHNTREINLEHENWLPSVTRAGIGAVTAAGTKAGEITLFDLLKESFRQRPDYVIVGEVRGQEAYVLFQGMASIKGNEEIFILKNNIPTRIKISELKDIKNCKAITYDLNKKETKLLPLAAIIKHPKRQILHKITTKLGREIYLTPNHSLFNYKEEIKVAQTNNLKIGDNIIIPARIPCGYNDLEYLNLIEFLSNARIYAPALIKEAVSKLGYNYANICCGVRSISDYYSNFKRSKPSSLKISKFISLMKEAEMSYNLKEISIKFDKKSESSQPLLKLSNEFLRLLGYYLSEGSLDIAYKSNKIALYNSNKKILKDMEYCIKVITGKTPKKRITKGWGTATELSFNHKVIYEFLKMYCGMKHNKQVPDFIFGLKKEKIGQLLSSLYAGDGYVNKNIIGFYTISKKLANDVSTLLLTLGIVAKINKRNRIGRKTTDYELLFYSAYKKNEFQKYIKPIGKILNKVFVGKVDKNILGDLYIDKIKSIEVLKLDEEEYVYDISVPGTQNFIGGFGGILLHNSGHPSLGTMHADSVSTMIKRLETPPINLSPSLVETMDAVCVMIQSKIKGKEVRRLSTVDEIIEVGEAGKARTNSPLVWDPKTDKFYFKTQSYIFEKISLKFGIPKEKLYNEFKLRSMLLSKLLQSNITGFKDVQKIIHEYYKSPVQVLRRFKII